MGSVTRDAVQVPRRCKQKMQQCKYTVAHSSPVVQNIAWSVYLDRVQARERRDQQRRCPKPHLGVFLRSNACVYATEQFKVQKTRTGEVCAAEGAINMVRANACGTGALSQT